MSSKRTVTRHVLTATRTVNQNIINRNELLFQKIEELNEYIYEKNLYKIQSCLFTIISIISDFKYIRNTEIPITVIFKLYGIREELGRYILYSNKPNTQNNILKLFNRKGILNGYLEYILHNIIELTNIIKHSKGIIGRR